MEDAKQCIRITDRSSGRASLTPAKAIMAMSERHFVFLTPDRSRVAQFDIETSKVVSDWKAAKDSARAARAIAPSPGASEGPAWLARPSQPASQPATQPPSQPASQPASHPPSQPPTPPARQPPSQPPTHPPTHPASQPASQPASLSSAWGRGWGCGWG